MTKEISKKETVPSSITKLISGISAPANELRRLMAVVAPTGSSALILGPTGSGKELVAKGIHAASGRKGPLISVNCAAIPTELIESELFGHEKGSFTSAVKQRIGKFEKANGGTLFLDEIGDMSLSAQAKVLRALQENKITRVGGEKEIDVDVRIIAATNKNLATEIEEGRFRMDLYHRISVILIHVPSLNERTDDIPMIAEKFLEEICQDNGIQKKQITSKGVAELKKINWTGNIRELRNVIERLVILCGYKITDEDVAAYANIDGKKSMSTEMIHSFKKFQDWKDYAEKLFIDVKLKKNNWNVAKTASEIEIRQVI